MHQRHVSVCCECGARLYLAGIDLHHVGLGCIVSDVYFFKFYTLVVLSEISHICVMLYLALTKTHMFRRRKLPGTLDSSSSLLRVYHACLCLLQIKSGGQCIVALV